jgi:hypothetical protein
MSFVDLMANDVWTEADITHRTEALLHGQVSKEDELILSREMIGYSLGLLIPTAEQQEKLTAYQMAAYAAQQSGIEAMADMALLREVIAVERAQARLTQLPVTEPAVVTVIDGGDAYAEIINPAIAADEVERAAAQVVIDAAGNSARSLVLLRNPPAEVLHA